MNKNNNFALVTGSSAGIGKDIANVLFKRGYNLLLVARNNDNLLLVKNDLHKINPLQKVEIFKANLSVIEEVYNVFKYTEENHFNIEVLVNNAASCMYG